MGRMTKEDTLPWWEHLRRKDCQKCKYKKACGDIFVDEGQCPANSGGEEWAKFTPEEAT